MFDSSVEFNFKSEPSSKTRKARIHWKMNRVGLYSGVLLAVAAFTLLLTITSNVRGVGQVKLRSVATYPRARLNPHRAFHALSTMKTMKSSHVQKLDGEAEDPAPEAPAEEAAETPAEEPAEGEPAAAEETPAEPAAEEEPAASEASEPQNFDEEEGPEGPGYDEIIFDGEVFNQSFLLHLIIVAVVLVCDLALFIYVRFIRPQQWFQEYIKSHIDKVSDGFASVGTDSEAYLDENDIAGSLVLVPGEAVFFNEEQTLSCGGVFGSCTKLSVTNKRVIAQRTDTTLLGMCMLQSYEDAWPIKSVSKVRLCTGEFFGYSVSGLLSASWYFFLLTILGNDFAKYYVSIHAELFERFLPLYEFELIFFIIGTALISIGILYHLSAIILLIFPQTLIKIYVTKFIEDKSSFFPHSVPMESFTFNTKHAYRAYQAIFAAHTQAGTGKTVVAGAFNEIPSGVYKKANAQFVAAESGKK
mmetsp:Transcript_64435/g.172557  ORF Transcript_64435/g.172557 Transcript_64435/m.172557 type:complete len:472 (-) Transcript_64435:201-1616(-)